MYMIENCEKNEAKKVKLMAY